MDLDLSQMFEVLVRAAQSGNWWFLLAAALMAITWGARRYLAPKVPWLKSDAGGVVLAFALAFFGALTAALGSGSALSVTLFVAAAKIAFTAMGGYAALRKLLLPLMGKLPFMPAAKAQALATQAGIEAVQAKPGPGAAGKVGEPKDVP